MYTPRVILNDATRSKWNSSAATIAHGAAVTQGVGDDSITVATTGAAAVIGLLANSALERGTRQDGPYQDVQTHNLAIGIAGTGGVSAGDRLTVDPLLPGCLVKATPAAGVTINHVGLANRSARQGELFEVELAGPGASLTG